MAEISAMVAKVHSWVSQANLYTYRFHDNKPATNEAKQEKYIKKIWENKIIFQSNPTTIKATCMRSEKVGLSNDFSLQYRLVPASRWLCVALCCVIKINVWRELVFFCANPKWPLQPSMCVHMIFCMCFHLLTLLDHGNWFSFFLHHRNHHLITTPSRSPSRDSCRCGLSICKNRL